MKFYNAVKSLPINNTLAVSLGTRLQTGNRWNNYNWDKTTNNNMLRPIAFPSKSKSSTERDYSSTDREELGIPYGVEKFHHYYFTRIVSIITDHKLQIATFKKYIAILSQWLQHIILRFHQYITCILHKPGQITYLKDNCQDRITKKTKMKK